MLTASGFGTAGSLLLGKKYPLRKCEYAIRWNPIPETQWFNLVGFNKGTKSKTPTRELRSHPVVFA